MADSETLHLKSGKYQIFSLLEGKPNVNVYVFLQKESESPYQPVRLDADNLEVCHLLVSTHYEVRLIDCSGESSIYVTTCIVWV